MIHIPKHVARYFGVRDGELAVAGVPITELVAEFGSPLYVYDPTIFRLKLGRLRAALPGLDVYYSVKANPTPAVLDVFLDEGCGLEIASGGELSLALRCGCDPARIIFAGPGKTTSELSAAVGAGIAEIHVESARELERLETVARHARSTVGVAIRVNPGSGLSAGALRMGGQATAFGVDEPLAPGVAEQVLRTSSLEYRGVHVYVATQILDPSALLRVFGYTIELAARLAKHVGRDVVTIDFGGGFGIPYFDGDPEFNIEEFGERLAPLIVAARGRKRLATAKLIVEPGRYLAAEGGLYLATVVDYKTCSDKKFAILDGGINHNLAASGVLGQVIRRNMPIAVGNRLTEEPTTLVNIVGPLCTPLDTLARDATLPDLHVGDVIAFFQSGAYGRSASPLQFLSHPEPAEVFVERGQARLVREAGRDADLFRGVAMESDKIAAGLLDESG